MPNEWGNIVREGRDGYLRFDYSMTTPILWSALQHALNKKDKLERDINKLKKIIATMKHPLRQKQKQKLKNKNM